MYDIRDAWENRMRKFFLYHVLFCLTSKYMDIHGMHTIKGDENWWRFHVYFDFQNFQTCVLLSNSNLNFRDPKKKKVYVIFASMKFFSIPN